MGLTVSVSFDYSYTPSKIGKTVEDNFTAV